MESQVVIRINADKITDFQTFHAVFAEAFGFPDFYGENMNAWIDCLTSLDQPNDGMTTIHVSPGQTLTLVIDNAKLFKERCPDVFITFVECSAFVNWRRIEVGEVAVLTLTFFS